jgi:hypothetical protein
LQRRWPETLVTLHAGSTAKEWLVILEGLVTTIDEDGQTNIAPMGPLVDESMARLCLRPYHGTTTYRNLERTREGIFHVTDDVLLIAQTAIGEADPPPRLLPAEAIAGHILADACRWYAFRVTQIEPERPRGRMQCQVVGSGRIRDFFGFNRAKHAVIEAAILATRVDRLPAEEINEQFDRLSRIVEKTAGEQERRALAVLNKYVAGRLDDDGNCRTPPDP